ncbi:MAG TPA: GNAT family N-acetyltransferase [Nocardioidaceae bacterium]|nr:GNAT family N-acetyltransferase [Nocardioidaceae bacterium]
MPDILESDRLVLRPWTVDDAEVALEIYGREEVAHWLSPEMDRVADEDSMRLLLQQWIAEDERAVPPTGRWAVELRDDKRVVGGIALLYLPPGGEDVELAFQVAPDEWGQGYATEAGLLVAHYALREHHAEEIFAVVRPHNHRAASTARRIGMEWAGETEKYYQLSLQVYRLRAADLDHPFPGLH